MKKIATLTFNRANNYGAMLQCYALKTTLNLLGARTSVINYKPRARKLTLREFIKRTLFMPWLIYVNNQFEAFRKPYLMDMPFVKRTHLPDLNDKFDLFIAGSDQVWNMDGGSKDASYLLDFVNSDFKKYSYSASMGKTEINLEEKEILARYLKLFQVISVRESSAVPLAKELSGKEDVRADIDPTLLLSKEAWRKTAVMPKEKDFILLYLMSNNSAIIGFARDLARKTGLKLIMLSTSPVPYKGVKVICPTPQEWLGYFLNAKYIVTNSFHGLAFSINFNKDFFVDLLPPPSKVNSRLENLLDLTNLRSRLISAGANFDTPAPDWAEVNAKLAAEKEKSLSYLRSMAE